MGDTRIKLLVPFAPSPNALLPYLEKIEAARWYTNFGPLNVILENSLAPRSHAVTVSSGTLALELALRATMPRHTRVLVPSFTYPATIHAILNAGHKPVFCDIDPRTWTMSEEIALRSYGWRDMLAPVCSFGARLEWPSHWTETPLVIDAAAAYLNQDTEENDAKHLTAYSLHATKYPCAGEGGFVTGPQPLIDFVRMLSNFGFADRIAQCRGTNAKLSEYHAAVALASLKAIDAVTTTLGAMSVQYRSLIAEHCPECSMQRRESDEIETSFSVLLPEGIDVTETAEFLGLRGIETRRWYWPLCHEMPAFRDFVQVDDLTHSKDISTRLLGLPFHMFLLPHEIEQIVLMLAKAIESQRAHKRKS